jgi:hypothetical membrane protein
MKKVITTIVSIITISLVYFSIRAIPDFLSIEEDLSDYTYIDIYNLPSIGSGTINSYQIVVDRVLSEGIGAPGISGKYYFVAGGLKSKPDSEMMLQILASSDEAMDGLDRLFLDADAPGVTLNGHMRIVPDATKQAYIDQLMVEGMTQTEAEQTFDEYIIPVFFMESEALGSLGRVLAVVLFAFTIGMIIIMLFLIRSVERDNDPGKFRTYKGPGFMHADGSVTLRDGKKISSEIVAEQSKASYNPPPSVYIPPSGMGDDDSFTPQEPYNPTLLKQPDYEDFFSDKKKPVGMGNLKPEKPKKAEKPDDMSELSLMPDAPIPQMSESKEFIKEAAPVEFFDELIAPPSEDELKASLNSEGYDDPISDINLEEYLSTDYLSPDKND